QQDQLNWLHRKASEHGFEILNVEHNIIGRAYRNGNKTSTVTAPLFKGVLTINDPIKVLDAIENGIGPQKHRGFGLLSILR
ncbi:type I-E CRISPR-associated protein Cas6/Cse3/CasE, partial [Klebsiella pneumoniae]